MDSNLKQSKDEILKHMSSRKKKRVKTKYRNNNIYNNNTQKPAWYYEIQNYRSQKKRERFYLIGAICGILSLVLTIVLNFNIIKEYFMMIIDKI